MDPDPMNEPKPEYSTEERANGLDVTRDGWPVLWVRREYFSALLAALLEDAGAHKMEVYQCPKCELPNTSQQCYGCTRTGRGSAGVACCDEIEAYVLPIPEDTT